MLLLQCCSKQSLLVLASGHKNGVWPRKGRERVKRVNGPVPSPLHDKRALSSCIASSSTFLQSNPPPTGTDRWQSRDAQQHHSCTQHLLPSQQLLDNGWNKLLDNLFAAKLPKKSSQKRTIFTFFSTSPCALFRFCTSSAANLDSSALASWVSDFFSVFSLG